ncbi:MAG TPA: hypothetical protein VGE39_09230 [Prosthecobacter sp.]
MSTLTLELDDAIAASLTSLAEAWHVPPQEAVKRAVSAAANAIPSAATPSALEIFRSLQAAVRLSPSKAEEWKNAVSDARR